MTFPRDFTVPLDQGGPGQGQHVAGFGGDPDKDRSGHRAAVQSVGKAPVILLHGNSGAADSGEWSMLDLQHMLMDSGYPEELIWAPSYLGRTGAIDNDFSNPTPHTNNVNEVREFIDNVCEYLDVDRVDIIAHSLGCTLAYAIFRGLKKQRTPIDFDQPKQWNRVGTLVALAGAFHGFGPNSAGEWETDGEFIKELLAEDLGGGGETPFGEGKPQTPSPAPHNITYFCGVARGDFVDASNPGTGKLEGAINKVYELGPNTTGHKKIKESRAVFGDFLPHLNSAPPAPSVSITIEDSGSHDAPLAITLHIDPSDKTVSYVANRVTKEFANGFIVDKIAENLEGTLSDGQTLTLPTDGMWEVFFSAAGAVDDIKKTYWVGVKVLETTIVTDNSAPFDASLVITATTTAPTAKLHHSFDGHMWNEGAAVTITEDKLVRFIAIDLNGLASEIVSKSFKKRPVGRAVTANVNGHFLAGRIGINEWLAYSRQFGLFAPFTLHLVDGDWVLDPNRPVRGISALTLTADRDSEAHAEPITVTSSAREDDAPPIIKVEGGDPQPGEYDGALTVTIEAVDDRDEHVTVHYTNDGSIPDENSPSFQDRDQFELSEKGNHIVTCYAKDSGGNETYRTFCYSIDGR